MITRREILRALALGGFGVSLPGCLVAERAPPALDHVQYPLGAIPRRGPSGLLVGAAKIDITPPAGARTATIRAPLARWSSAS